MPRQLKFHEKKLLKKLNLLEWKREGGHREAGVMQRFLVTDRDDYKNKIKIAGIMLCVGWFRDPFRIEMTDHLLEKLYNMGVIPNRKSLAVCERLGVSSFCKRRLATIMVKQKFAEHKKAAVTYIEQAHVRVGIDTVTDPAFLVTRNMEDLLTWESSSKINKGIQRYNDKLDDYDLMQ